MVFNKLMVLKLRFKLTSYLIIIILVRITYSICFIFLKLLFKSTINSALVRDGLET